MPRCRLLLTALTLLLAAAPVLAQTAADTPVGTWKTIDDSTGQAKALVQISEHDGVLEGKVVKILHSTRGPHPRCDQCDGARKGQPILGMTILWGMHQDGDVWNGGHILDPDKGSTYKCRLQVIDGGHKLKVRGYIGFALLGRTQVWVRQP